MGCLKAMAVRLGCLVLLVLAALLGWLYRERLVDWYQGLRGGSAAGAPRFVSPGPDDLERARLTLRRLAEPGGPALAELGAIIVAPDSLNGGWDSAENDRAVIQLLDTVLASYSIDTTKIVVTGFSMGGAGTWHFAAKYPQRFSAAVPLAGRPTPSAAGWKLPVLAIHSRIDEVVPFGPTEARIAELKKAGVHAELIAVNGISHYQTFRFAEPLRQAVPWLREVWKK